MPARNILIFPCGAGRPHTEGGDVSASRPSIRHVVKLLDTVVLKASARGGHCTQCMSFDRVPSFEHQDHLTHFHAFKLQDPSRSYQVFSMKTKGMRLLQYFSDEMCPWCNHRGLDVSAIKKAIRKTCARRCGYYANIPKTWLSQCERKKYYRKK